MTHPTNACAVVHPEVAADVLAGLREAARGEGIVLTPEQLARWAATGDFPWESDTTDPSADARPRR